MSECYRGGCEKEGDNLVVLLEEERFFCDKHFEKLPDKIKE